MSSDLHETPEDNDVGQTFGPRVLERSFTSDQSPLITSTNHLFQFHHRYIIRLLTFFSIGLRFCSGTFTFEG